jgi:hypothetical protein
MEVEGLITPGAQTMGLGTVEPSVVDQREKEASKEEERALESTQLLTLSSPALTFNFLTGNPCPPVSSLNFMLNSLTLVGNEWIEALGNLSISPKPTISRTLPRIQPALCPSSSERTYWENKCESSSDSEHGVSSSKFNNFKVLGRGQILHRKEEVEEGSHFYQNLNLKPKVIFWPTNNNQLKGRLELCVPKRRVQNENHVL